jgi:hypothetical protein
VTATLVFLAPIALLTVLRADAHGYASAPTAAPGADGLRAGPMKQRMRAWWAAARGRHSASGTLWRFGVHRTWRNPTRALAYDHDALRAQGLGVVDLAVM